MKCTGFKAAGIASGLKKNGNPDLGLIFSEVPANVAGVFTKNKIQAAPVLLDKERVKSGICQAVIVNSGNANCCTGEKGMQDAIAMTKFAAAGLNIDETSVMVASTGVIGNLMPIGKVEEAAPALVSKLSPDGFPAFTNAIMTTDTVPKMVSKQGQIADKRFTIIGAAKGAGMIRPDMATMLCFVCTDIGASPEILRETLPVATNLSFNRITIDGDTSTNDTILLMANGLSGAVIKDSSHKEIFQGILNEVLLNLARMVVRDGEGATKFVEIIVKGASSDNDARIIADTIAHSNLVKTALFGEDANWGRIIAAAGRANVPVDPNKISIFFNKVRMVENGTGCGSSAEANATEVLKTSEFVITVDLNMGNGEASVFTCDFSLDYVKINADYRS